MSGCCSSKKGNDAQSFMASEGFHPGVTCRITSPHNPSPTGSRVAALTCQGSGLCHRPLGPAGAQPHVWPTAPVPLQRALKKRLRSSVLSDGPRGLHPTPRGRRPSALTWVLPESVAMTDFKPVIRFLLMTQAKEFHRCK